LRRRHFHDDLVGPNPTEFLSHGALACVRIRVERVQFRLDSDDFARETPVLFALGVILRDQPSMARQAVGPQHHHRDPDDGRDQQDGGHQERESLAKVRHGPNVPRRGRSTKISAARWALRFAVLRCVPMVAPSPVLRTDGGPSGGIEVPIRSDPPWLSLGIGCVIAGSIALSLLYFRTLEVARPPLALALFPAFAAATFASAGLAWWSRRRSRSSQLRAEPGRLVLQEPGRRALIVDYARPFGATLVAQPGGGRRALVLSQSGEPWIVLDTSKRTAPAGGWSARTVSLDLQTIALSPASANVVAVSDRGELGPLLDTLAPHVDADAPRLAITTATGAELVLTADSLRVGDAEFPREGTVARRMRIAAQQGEIDGLSLARGDRAVLIASHGGAEQVEPADEHTAPEAVLSPILFEMIASVFAVSSS